MKRRVTIFVAAVANEWIYCCCSFGKHTRERLPSSHSFLYSPTLHSRSSGLSLDMARWMSRWFVVWDGRSRPAASSSAIYVDYYKRQKCARRVRWLSLARAQTPAAWKRVRDRACLCAYILFQSPLARSFISKLTPSDFFSFVFDDENKKKIYKNK